MVSSNLYRQSEIDFLKEIPSDWTEKKVKFLGDIRYGLGQPPKELENGLPILRATNVSVGKITTKNMLFVDPNDLPYDRNPLLKKDEIIVVRSGAYTGDSAIIPEEYSGAVTGYDMVFTPKLVVPKFIAYAFLSNYVYKNQLVICSLRAAQPHLNKEELGNTMVALPPNRQQFQIANYLDTKTQALDKKINLLTQKANYYKEYRKSIINETVCKGLDKNVKLKDSGIDWIGQIPEHWEVKRFKDVCYKNTTGGTPSTSSAEHFHGENTWVTIADLGNSKFVETSKLGLTDEAIKLANIPITPKGSLIYSFKLTVGKIAFAKKDLYTNEALISIMPNKHINLEYYYFMLPIFLLINATENIYGAKMLNQKLISNTILVYPPLKEQTEIAKYLDDKTQTIDKIITNINTQILSLKELRKTLINDVVTGKIKVVE